MTADDEDIRHPRFPPAKRHRDADGDHRLPDAGHARAEPRQCGAGHPWQHQRAADDRSRRIDRRRQLERDRRPRQGGRYRPLLCDLPEHAGIVLRIDQCGEHRSRDRQAVTGRGFPTSPSATSSPRSARCSISSASKSWSRSSARPMAASRRFNGRSNYPGMMKGHRADRHLADGAARALRGQCRAAARDPVEGSELERRRLLRSRRRAGDHDPDPHRPR